MVHLIRRPRRTVTIAAGLALAIALGSAATAAALPTSYYFQNQNSGKVLTPSSTSSGATIGQRTKIKDVDGSPLELQLWYRETVGTDQFGGPIYRFRNQATNLCIHAPSASIHTPGAEGVRLIMGGCTTYPDAKWYPVYDWDGTGPYFQSEKNSTTMSIDTSVQQSEYAKAIQRFMYWERSQRWSLFKPHIQAGS